MYQPIKACPRQVGTYFAQVNVGIVRFPHAGNITAAACFKAQRVVGDGWIVAAATAAGVGPVGVDGGICMRIRYPS